MMEKELRVNNFDLLRIVALTFVAGLLSWRLVEKPFLKRKRQSMHAVGNAAG